MIPTRNNDEPWKEVELVRLFNIFCIEMKKKLSKKYKKDGENHCPFCILDAKSTLMPHHF